MKVHAHSLPSSLSPLCSSRAVAWAVFFQGRCSLQHRLSVLCLQNLHLVTWFFSIFPQQVTTTKSFKLQFFPPNCSCSTCQTKRKLVQLNSFEKKMEILPIGMGFFSSSSVQWQLEAAAGGSVGLEGRGCPVVTLLHPHSAPTFGSQF